MPDTSSDARDTLRVGDRELGIYRLDALADRYDVGRLPFSLEGLRVVPPATGIVHQVNLEHLARVVFVDDKQGVAYPDTLVGTDSHTTMVNGLGVLGWGVGGI